MSVPQSKFAKSILATLVYSDHFGFPLTLKEIHLRLVHVPVGTTLPAQAGVAFATTLAKMVSNHQIEQSGDYFYLPGRKSLIALRLKRATLSTPQLVNARLLAGRLSRRRGILAIYLTGSLAVMNSDKDADIDFMIITHPHRLWTTRLLLTLYTEILGLRRRPYDQHSSGKICLNLYLTPDSYLLPRSKQSLYTAYELIQAVPLYDPCDTHSSLLAANPWIKKYLSNFPFPAAHDLASRSDLLRKRPKGVFSRLQHAFGRPGRTFMELTEKICYHLQLLYMRPKLTHEYVTIDSAFFHPNNPAPKI
jgi:predicted nucleotidyltransferase